MVVKNKVNNESSEHDFHPLDTAAVYCTASRDAVEIIFTHYFILYLIGSRHWASVKLFALINIASI